MYVHSNDVIALVEATILTRQAMLRGIEALLVSAWKSARAATTTLE